MYFIKVIWDVMLMWSNALERMREWTNERSIKKVNGTHSIKLAKVYKLLWSTNGAILSWRYLLFQKQCEKWVNFKYGIINNLFLYNVSILIVVSNAQR